MNKKLSKRLSACLDALSSLSIIADIGTDHAYLPCYAVANGIIDSAIAIDVIDGPLAQAKATISDYGLLDSIEIRKGSGLEPLKIGEVEGVNIAGMGGKLISQLLLESIQVAHSMKKLVLQPQSGETTLRRMLFGNGFVIEDEQLIKEDGIIYTIITVVPGNYEFGLTVNDLIFGPVLKNQPTNKLFQEKWEQEISSIDFALSKIPDGNEKRLQFEQKRQLIKDVLAGDIS